MNKKKKLSIVFLLILLLNLQIEPINAISLNENTGGTASEYIEGVTCDIPHNGCHYWSEEFVVEMALVDERMVIVENTKSVQFIPQNPYNHDDYMKYYKPVTTTPEATRNNNWLNPNMAQDIVYDGLYTVMYGENAGFSKPSEKIEPYMYSTYMGFGYEHEEIDNFTTYEKHRDDFIRYIKSRERKSRVIDGDFDKEISFIDFFLKLCGYTDEWNYTESYENLKKLKDKNYYIVIEPIYTVSTYYNGNNHSYRMTAKNLGNLLWTYPQAWAYNDNRYNWFTIFNDFNEPRYNLLCNFYDKSGYNNQTLRLTGEYNKENTGNWTDPTAYINNKEYICQDPNSIYSIGTREMSNLLGWSQSPFGVNIISLKHDFSDPEPTEYVCNIDVNTCKDDLFKYELNLTPSNGDEKSIYNCVYPSNVESDKLDKYFYHVGENGNELWCYDNISYDFSALKEEVGNTTMSSGKLQNLPNGVLKVDRTCYSKAGEANLKGYLDQIFKTDAGTYQDTFNFNFNNQNYTYKRNPERYTYKDKDNGKKYQHSSRSWYDTVEPTKTSRLGGNGTDFYTYKSTFYYDYEIDNSYNNIQSININDYSLGSSLINTNSIKFMTRFDNAVVIKKQDKKITTYFNELSKPTNNAYGLSSKLYNELKNNSTSSNGDTVGTNTYSGSGKAESEKAIISLNYSETSKNSCELQTTVKDNDILGDGLKFRVISLSDPFPARDGTTRLAGENWINKESNNVYNYIQNNRNVKAEEVYQKEPLYTITLDPSSMIKIREYNKSHSYNDSDIICEEGKGRKCISNFLRNNKYIKNIEGNCYTNIDAKNTTNFYTCADKTEKSGG